MNIANYSAIKGTSIQLVSLSGEVIQRISNTDDSGNALRCMVNAKKNGGTDTVTFSVDRKTNIPTFTGMLVEVYKDNVLFTTVYSNTVPKPGSEENILEISCLGYMHKLDTKLISIYYGGITLKDVIAANASNFAEVDILYDPLKIDLPNILVPYISFDSQTLRKVVESMLSIANSNYNNAQYRWFIDNDRYINFELIDNGPYKGLFEGFNYQSPEIEEDDSQLVNQIFAYAANIVNVSNLDFSEEYNDTESQGKYGVKSKKFVFSDVLDNSIVDLMSLGIIERFKDPKTKIKINDLVGTDFPFKFYTISNRIDNYWKLLSECDSFENWNLTGAPSTTITLAEDVVLTGRRSIKCVTGAGSIGDEIMLTPPTIIFSPQIFRMYIYMAEAINFDVIIEAEDGEQRAFNLGSSILNMEVNNSGTIKNIEANSSGTIKNLQFNIQISYVAQWLKIEVPLTLRSIKTVTVLFKSETIVPLYIDRIETQTNSYNTNTLTLEKISYILDRDFALSNAEFGEEFETLHNEIQEQVENGKVALALAAKEGE